MTDTIAIVTGGLRGLGRAMTLGLLGLGHRVTAVGHIADDAVEMRTLASAHGARLLPLVADLRKPSECDRVFAPAPGLTILTVTPVPSSSLAQISVAISSAAFDGP